MSFVVKYLMLHLPRGTSTRHMLYMSEFEVETVNPLFKTPTSNTHWFRVKVLKFSFDQKFIHRVFH